MTRDAGCITNEYMATSTVMTLRIDTRLHAALKRKARDEGRSVSSEVVRLIRAHLEPAPAPRRARSSFGMFEQFDSVDVDEVRELRHSVTRAATRRARRTKR